MKVARLLVPWLPTVALSVALAEPEATAPQAHQVFARARPKVTVLRGRRAGEEVWGTGFLAAPGVVLTAGHVAQAARQLEVRLNGVAYPAQLAAADRARDLAALTFTRADLLLKPLSLANSRHLQAGDRLLIVTSQAARPGANGEIEQRLALPAVFERHVQKRGPIAELGPQLAVAARVERGDSGAPLLRLTDGAVVGIVVSRELPDAEGMSRVAYAIPAELAVPLVERVLGRNAPSSFYLIPLAQP